MKNRPKPRFLIGVSSDTITEQKYLLDKLIIKLKTLTKTLDRYYYMMMALAIFGFYKSINSNFGQFNFLPFQIPYENLGIFTAICLLVIFGVLGSKLIEYLSIRTKFEILFFDYQRNINLRVLNSIDPKDLINFSTFYEWIYSIKYIRNWEVLKKLWLPAAFIFFFTLTFANTIGLVLILKYDFQSISTTFIIAILYILFVLILYHTFLSAIIAVNSELGKTLRSIIISYLILILIVTMFLFKHLQALFNLYHL